MKQQGEKRNGEKQGGVGPRSGSEVNCKDPNLSTTKSQNKKITFSTPNIIEH